MTDWQALLRRPRIDLLVTAARNWSDDRAIRLGAALAYYSLFALIPILFVSVSLASIVIRSADVIDEVADAIANVLGDDVAAVVVRALDAVDLGWSNEVTSIIGFLIVAFTASFLFTAWRDVVNLLWRIPRHRGLRASVRRRAFGGIAVVGAGALLTLVLAAQTVTATLDSLVDLVVVDLAIRLSASLIPAAIGAGFLAVLFRYTPERHVAWRAVVLPAVLTMVLLSVGAWGYGLYLDVYGFASAAGVAGSAFLGLVFVYLSAQVLLYGVEVSREIQWRLDGVGSGPGDSQPSHPKGGQIRDERHGSEEPPPT